MKRTLALACLAALLPGAAHAACTVSKWGFAFGRETSAQMKTDGAECRSTVAWTRGAVEVQAVAISSAARNGSAAVSGTTVTYTPTAGFKGADAFAFTITGRKNGRPAAATVRVAVTVQ